MNLIWKNLNHNHKFKTTTKTIQFDDFLETVVKKLILETLRYQQKNRKVNKENESSRKLYLIIKYERRAAGNMLYLGKFFDTRLVNTNTMPLKKNHYKQ